MKTTWKTFVRNYKKRNIIYTITIGGFAISMAVFFFIVAFIIDERKVDQNIPQVESLYRMVIRGFVNEDTEDIIELTRNSVPAIEDICVYGKEYVLFEYDKINENVEFLMASKGFFDIFPVEIKRGRIWNHGAKNEILITEDYAERVFIDEDPIGKTVAIKENQLKQVVGVINNPTKYSSLQYQLILPLQNDLFSVRWPRRNGGSFMLNSAFHIPPTENADTVRAKLDKALERYTLNKLKGRDDFFVQAYSEIYFSNAFDEHHHANIDLIKLLSYIAIILLVLAILNYINLSTASNLERFKEVCIRKTSGAKNLVIIQQFLSESYLACFIALLLSIGFLAFLSPVFSSILEHDFNAFKNLNDWMITTMILTSFIVVGAITGLVPAIIASTFQPIQLIQKRIKRKGISLRGMFNSIQFVVTIVLIICLITINQQIEYAKTKDYGFNKDQLLSIRMEGRTQKHINTIAEELSKYAAIKDLTISMGIPLQVEFSRGGSIRVDNEEIPISFAEIHIDPNFIKTFEIPLIMGRNVRETERNTCLINERFYKKMEWKDLNNKYIWDMEVVGIVKDFHTSKLDRKIENLVLRHTNTYYTNMDFITIRMDDKNIPEHMAYIKSVVKEFDPYINLDYRFYDERIEQLYKKEEKQAEAIRFYAIITIIISCLGLIGMVEFACKKKTKEIGVRKVNGAHIQQVILLLIKEFSLVGLAAFVIACPIAIHFMNKWLENYAYKTNLSWWFFALGGLITMIIAVVTVSFQSWKTARKNPVESLRYE